MRTGLLEATRPEIAASHADHRGATRVYLRLAGATFRQPLCSPAPVVVEDLSTTGFRTDWPYRLNKDDRVWLKLPGYEALPARVAWFADFHVGCRFEHALHPAVLDTIVRTAARLGH